MLPNDLKVRYNANMNKKVLLGAVLLVIIISGVIGAFYLNRSKDEDTVKITSEKDIAVDTLSSELLTAQESYADKLIIYETDDELYSRLADLLSPLGPLDPIATDKGDKTQMSTFNALFGYYSAKNGVSKDRTMHIAESPLIFALEDFDYKDYYRINSQKLEELDSDIKSIDKIWILGDFGLEGKVKTFKSQTNLLF